MHLLNRVPPNLGSIPTPNLGSASAPSTPISPQEIREALIQKKVLPTREEAETAFWFLGDDCWKQIIDGEVHHLGREVFDQGKHNGIAESGYSDGIEAGSRCYFRTRNFYKELNVDIYEQIHDQACSHFRLEQGNGILCSFEDVRHFRTTPSSADTNISKWITDDITRGNFLEGVEQFNKLESIQRRLRLTILKMSLEKMKCEHCDGESDVENEKYTALSNTYDEIIREAKLIVNLDDIYLNQSGLIEQGKTICGYLEEKLSELSERGKKIGAQIVEKMNVHAADFQKKLGVEKPIISFHLAKSFKQISIMYHGRPAAQEDNLKKITNDIFSLFNSELASLQKKAYEKIFQQNEEVEEVKKSYQEEVLPLIAQLYAWLDRAHPWIDGQGRTDLIVLGGTLCREGLHPCVLQYPYFSTWHSPDEWLEYLQNGLEEYKKLC